MTSAAEHHLLAITSPTLKPQELGTDFWVKQFIKQQQQLEQAYRTIEQQQQQIEQQQQRIEQLLEELNKLKHRTSDNSSIPPAQNTHKKPNRKPKPGKKRGPKYGHPGCTRNGFGEPDDSVELRVESCPRCGSEVEPMVDAPTQKQQVAELVHQPVEIWEYHRPLYKCSKCGQGYSSLPWGVKAGFSYGAKLSSLVGWMGYGGNLSWHKQRYLIETIFGIPISQGSLAKMHQWFRDSLQGVYQSWFEWLQTPGVCCVDETVYRIDGIKHWLWVSTSQEVCVLFLAPTRSAAVLQQLLAENFEGILSSDCYGAYNRQTAAAKQKCLTHFERDLRALETSRFAENREFASPVFPILQAARQHHQDYHQGKLTLEQLQQKRPEIEVQLAAVLDNTIPRQMGSRCPTLSQSTENPLVRLVYLSDSSRSEAG